MWLLSSDATKLSDKSLISLVDMTYNGVLHFLTFSAKPAGSIEQSLGKMFMSLVALVFGVSACYRTLKRGAVQGRKMKLNYSLTVQSRFQCTVSFQVTCKTFLYQ